MDLLGFAPGMKVGMMNAGAEQFSEALSAAVGEGGHVHRALSPRPTELASQSYDQIILANLTGEELRELGATLEDARRLLEHGGRLLVIGQGSEARAFAHVVHTLELNCWTIHRHLEPEPHEYLIEATVTDESVQS